MSHTDPHDAPTSGGYERTDADPRGLVMWSLGLLGALVASVLAAWVLFDVFLARAERHDPLVTPLAAADNPQPPEPRLVVDEPSDRKTVLEKENEVLESYGWIDKQRGQVRIPIGRAMDLVAEQGLPSRATGAKTP
jgi:hypothetical protein